LRYGLAFVAVAAGFGFRAALTAWIGPGLPTFITFYPAVMVAALLAGFGPGLLATVLTGIVVGYWILPPVGQWAIASPVNRVGLVLFIGMGLFMSAVAEFYRRDRRKAWAYDEEKALRETRREKEFLADVLEHTSQPFTVGYPDGRLGLCNQAYEQLTGYRAEELRAIDWATMLTPPEWREMEKQKLDELHRSGQPVRYEKEYVRKDGTRVPIELLVHLVKDAKGKPEYYYSFLTDITGRKRAQTALRESTERLNFALETSHTGAWDLDLADHTAFRSLEHDCVFGYAELLPKWTYEMFLEHVLPEDRAMVDGKFRRAMESQGDWSFECRIRRKDGQVRWIWGAGRHRLVAAGAPRRMAGIVQDITERKQAEEALRESEERHQLATGVAKEAIWEVNLKTGTVRWNHAYIELFGRPAEANAHGPWWLSRIHPEDRERVDASFAKVLAEGGDSWTCDYRMKLADDSYAFLNDRAIIVRDKAGSPLRAVGAKLNVTERKQAEEALTNQRKELQVILESVPAMIFYKDKENHFVHTNKAFEDAMGLPKEKLQGQSLFDLYPKEMAEAYWNDDKEVMASRNSKYGIVEPMQTPNGTRIIQTDKIPYFDESGNVIGVVGFAIDITERKRVEEALKTAHAESEVRVEERTAEVRAVSLYARNLIETSLDPLVTISKDGKITDVNHATELATGVPRERLIGSNFSDYFTEPDKANAGYQKVIAEGLVRNYPLTIRHVAGHTLHVLYNAAVYHNEAGEIQGVFAAARDITERKRMEDAHLDLQRRLVKAQETERGRISRELHDQLGQDLTALKLGLQMFRKQRTFSPPVQASIGQLEKLADSLMQDIHRLAWELRPAALDDFGLDMALRRYASEWSEHNGVAVDFHSQGVEAHRLPTEVETTLYRITQEALTNVLRHAKAQRVGVILERRPDHVLLIVEDDGRGFDAQAVLNAADAHGKLGLLGMQERVMLANGTIEIESAPGAGTTMFVRIPLDSKKPAVN
jgi:PAS domain S-box-containing protein